MQLSPMLGMMMGRIYASVMSKHCFDHKLTVKRSSPSITLLVNLNRRAHVMDETDGHSRSSDGRLHSHSASEQVNGKTALSGRRGGVNVQTLTNVHFDEATVYEPVQVRQSRRKPGQGLADADSVSLFAARRHHLPIEATLCRKGGGSTVDMF